MLSSQAATTRMQGDEKQLQDPEFREPSVGPRVVVGIGDTGPCAPWAWSKTKTTAAGAGAPRQEGQDGFKAGRMALDAVAVTCFMCPASP